MDKQSAVKFFQALNPDVCDVGSVMRGANELISDPVSRFSEGEIAIVEFTKYLADTATRKELDLITVFETLERGHIIMNVASVAPQEIRPDDVTLVSNLKEALSRLDKVSLFDYPSDLFEVVYSAGKL